MKKYKEWTGTFSSYVSAGDQIDPEMFYYFLGVLPPILDNGSAFLMGEAYNRNTEGTHQYMCFVEIKNKYHYKGLMTVNEFKEEKEWKSQSA